MRGIKCFACEGECRPPRMEKIGASNGPNSGDVPAPKPENTPTPKPEEQPAPKPEGPPASKPEELPVAPKPAYVRLPT